MTIPTEKLQALLDEATPGPWFHDSYGWIQSSPLCAEYGQMENTLPDDPDEWDVEMEARLQEIEDRGSVTFNREWANRNAPNARLIALAPTIAAEVLDLRSELAAAREALRELRRVALRQDPVATKWLADSIESQPPPADPLEGHVEVDWSRPLDEWETAFKDELFLWSPFFRGLGHAHARLDANARYALARIAGVLHRTADSIESQEGRT